ncbi:ester cyclase [Pacificoceanicola onchidii]|uniref:nuclear transport factor 2 family protein n=1 Tax=Pacificoceanicola onchidii TaxID=2562685 RepID=UPI0010A3F602|nr:ester cyclase [Pacificoceanicola onchidii]
MSAHPAHSHPLANLPRMTQSNQPLGQIAAARAASGSDPAFNDFLRETTHVMRSERTIAGALKSCFHAHVIRRDALGIAFGTGSVLADLQGQMVAVPDQVALTEDVFSTGKQERGFLGASRVWLQGHHRGPGPFGAPTGRALRYRELSETYAKNNRISDIWSVRDHGAVCAQLGLEPERLAADLWQRADLETMPFRPEVDQQGPYTGEGNGSQWGLAFAELLTRILDGELQTITDQYDAACGLSFPGGVEQFGHDAATQFWMGLRAAFPSAEFRVHHTMGCEEPLMPARAAVRWSLSGRHEGWGIFGPPTGAPVHIMGMSHAEFGPQGLRREWTLYDSLAIWMQIVAHRGV